MAEQKIIIPKHGYIINVEGNFRNDNKWYKVGEGNTVKRPDGLVEKYNKFSANKATKLLFRELPHTKEKRLNDKVLHKFMLQSGKFERVDDIYVEHFLGEKDGKNEFFRLIDKTMTDEDVVNFINNLIDTIPTVNYTTKNTFDIKIPQDEYHKISNVLLQKMFEHYPDVYNAIYKETGNNHLIIGQPEPDFVATIAMYNKVYIWHDTPENKHEYAFEDINTNIKYVESLKELLEMSDNIKFRTILENAPYGRTGAQINNTVRSSVDWDYCVSLLPIKDMPLDGLDGCSYIDMQRVKPLPPHTFPDADILTHILIFTKNKIKDYNSFEEVCADSFIVDKPMIKFMRANELKQHYAISNIRKFDAGCDVTKTFVFHHFDTGSAHTSGLPKITSDIPKNKYNFKNIDESINGVLLGVDKAVRFNTSIEKDRFTNLVKVARNFINRMIANQFIAIRDTGACFPKINLLDDKWDVKNIQDEETAIRLILEDIANYNEAEVKAVLDTMDQDYFIGDDEAINRLFGVYLNEIK